MTLAPSIPQSSAPADQTLCDRHPATGRGAASPGASDALCFSCQADAAGAGTITKRPGGSGARPASGGALARKGPARKTTGSRPAGGSGGAGILRFYTDDAPGLKMCAPP